MDMMDMDYMKLPDKTANFIETTARNLIKTYEDATGKTYDYKNVSCIEDVANFLGAKIIYLNNMYSKYNTEEMLISNDKPSFTIIIDKEYKKNRYTEDNINFSESLRSSILRMVWMYFEARFGNYANDNTLLYPANSNIELEEIYDMIKEQEKNPKRKLKK